MGFDSAPYMGSRLSTLAPVLNTYVIAETYLQSLQDQENRESPEEPPSCLGRDIGSIWRKTRRTESEGFRVKRIDARTKFGLSSKFKNRRV